MAADKVVTVRLRASVGEYTSGMARAGGQTVTFGGQLATAAKTQDRAMAQARQTMRTLGTAAAVAGKLILAGVGGAMVVSAKAAIDFESSLAGIAKTVEGTPRQIEAIGEAMRNLSLSIPVNVNELNRIAELGGQLGVQIPNLVEFTEVIAALGVTTNLSTEDAATGLARLANVTGLSQQDFGRLGSAIVDLGNNFATTESEILTFALRIAPAAQTVGVTADEVLGLAAALSSMGIPAERGGTAVQQMFTIIGSAARSGGEELDAMAAITGTTADEFKELALASPSDALVLLAQSLGEANDRGENVFLMMKALGINGKRAQAVLLAMSNNTDLLTDSLERSEVAMDENTALFEEAAKRYGTTESEIRLMANAFTDLRIEIGQELIPFIKDTVQLIGALFQVMKDNIGAVKAFGIVVLGVGAAFVAWKISRIISGMITFGIEVGKAIKLLAGLRIGIGLTAGAGAAAATVLSLGLTVVLGALAIKAFNAAQKMAELRQNAADFESAIEAGTDPTIAFLNVLDPERLDDAAVGLEAIGSGIVDIGEAGAGLDLDALNALLDRLKSERTEVAQFKGKQSRTEALARVAEQDALDAAIAATEEALGTSEQRLADRSGEMARAVMAAVPEVEAGYNDLRASAARFLQNNPLATDIDFTNLMSARFVETQGDDIDGITTSVERVTESWRGWLAVMDEGKAETQFLEDIDQFASDWADSVQESMADVKESVLGQFPAWDEYGEVVELNLQDVLDSAERFLEDMRQWGPAQESLIGNVSQATLDWFDALDPLTQGALGRIFANDPLEFATFASDMDTKLTEGNRIAEEKLLTRLPAILDSAVLTIPQKIQALVDELKLPAGDSALLVGAYNDGLNSFIATLPEVFGPDLAAAITALLTPGQDLLNTASLDGFMIGESWISGMNAAILSGKVSLPAVVKEGVTGVITKSVIDDWQQRSPSKVAMKLGEGFIEGLGEGMTNSLDTDMFQRVVPSFQASLDAAQPNVTVQTPEGGNTVQVYVDNPGGDIADQVQLGLMMSGVTERIEWAGSTSFSGRK